MTATATNRQLLVDPSGPIKLDLKVEEAEGGKKKLFAEGKIGHCDIPTANGRVYTRPVMGREIARLQPRIEQASLFAAVDHPADGKSKLSDAGAIIRSLKIEQDGTINGKFEIIEDTTKGRDLAAILRAGGQVGVSSRGLGSTTTIGGNEVVGEDFRLVSFDFVSDPAVQTAYPQFFAEDLDTSKVTVPALRAKFPALVKQIEEAAYAVATNTACEAVRADIENDVEKALTESKDKLREEFKAELYPEVVKDLKEDFAVKLLRATADIRKDVEAVVRSEMAADPQVAGAKLTLAKIAEMVNPFAPTPDVKKALDEKDSVAAELKKALSDMEKKLEQVQAESNDHANKARTTAFQLFVERSVAGRTDSDAIRQMVGDLSQIKSASELKQKVEAAIEAANQALEEATAKAKAALQAESSIAEKKAQIAQKRAAKLQETDELLKEKVSALAEQVENLMAAKNQEAAENKKRIAALEDRLARAAQVIEEHETAAFANTRLAGHPNRKQILADIGNGKVRSRNQINQLAEATDTRDVVGSESVRRFFGKGREHPTETDRAAQEKQLNEGYTPLPGFEELGISAEQIKALSQGGRTRR
jgi:hypothetical protein